MQIHADTHTHGRTDKRGGHARSHHRVIRSQSVAKVRLSPRSRALEVNLIFLFILFPTKLACTMTRASSGTPSTEQPPSPLRYPAVAEKSGTAMHARAHTQTHTHTHSSRSRHLRPLRHRHTHTHTHTHTTLVILIRPRTNTHSIMAQQKQDTHTRTHCRRCPHQGTILRYTQRLPARPSLPPSFLAPPAHPDAHTVRCVCVCGCVSVCITVPYESLV